MAIGKERRRYGAAPVPDLQSGTGSGICSMDVVTVALIAGIQTQRLKLQRAAKKYGRMSINAFKRLDFERGIINGAKALAAQQADQILKAQQDRLRQASG
jgi:hypothetical protein